MADEMISSDFWDARYASEGYLFGAEPARFLGDHAGLLRQCSDVLCVADGEGRNSVALAARGHRVTAFDISPVALDKARKLAAARGVAVDFRLSGVEQWEWAPPRFDAVAAIFIQFAAPPLRARIFAGLGQALRPGGLLLLHGYAPRQVGYGTGGPPVSENMYTLDLLRQAFAGWRIVRAADYDRDIDEGAGHSGRSALIDLVARKPG